MPTFRPTLGETSTIRIPPSQPDYYLHLHFTLTGPIEELEDGTWEIWTDLPTLNKDGQLHVSSGEWHSKPFTQDLLSPSSRTAVPQASNSVITLKSVELSPRDPTFRQIIFTANMVIKALEGSRFAYTFRRVSETGEIYWLGGESGNGVIEMVASDEAEETEDSPGRHDLKNWECEGFGLKIEEISGVPTLKTYTLPQEESVEVQLVITSAKEAAHQMPVHSFSGSNIARPLVHQQISLGCGCLPFTIEPGMCTPNSNTAAITRVIALPEQLTDAFQMADVGKIFTSARIRELGGMDEPGTDIIAFYYTPITVDLGQSLSYLVIFRPSTSFQELMSIGFPASFAPDVPIAVTDLDGESAVISPHGERLIDFVMPEEGMILQQLKLISFTPLRSNGDIDPIWICAPHAIQVEAGEEEITGVVNGDEGGSNGVENGRGDDAFSTFTQETPELEDDDMTLRYYDSHGASDPNASPRWLFRLIGRFFSQLWRWIMLPFRDNIGRESNQFSSEVDIDEESETEEEEAGSKTPTHPDERTPLLQAEMSRSTTLTEIAPILSPTPRKFSSSASLLKVMESQANQSRSLSRNLTPFEQTVEVRSYARFEFPKSPTTSNIGDKAYQFLLPPGATLEGRVKAKYRYASEDWNDASLEENTVEDKYVEVCLAGIDGAVMGETGLTIEMERVA